MRLKKGEVRVFHSDASPGKWCRRKSRGQGQQPPTVWWEASTISLRSSIRVASPPILLGRLYKAAPADPLQVQPAAPWADGLEYPASAAPVNGVNGRQEDRRRHQEADFHPYKDDKGAERSRKPHRLEFGWPEETKSGDPPRVGRCWKPQSAYEDTEGRAPTGSDLEQLADLQYFEMSRSEKDMRNTSLW
eukprot:s50_g18.t1